jgi:hypothetical protein
MAITMATTNADFFSKVLNNEPQAYGYWSSMSANGMSFSVELYAIKASKGGVGQMLNLTTSTSAIMKASTLGGPVPVEVQTAKKQLVAFLSKLYAKEYGTSVSVPEGVVTSADTGKPTPTSAWPDVAGVTSVSAAASAAMAATSAANTGVTPAAAAAAAVAASFKTAKQFKSMPGVVKLSEAEVIGQAVNGTSPGSIYYLVAANDRVKVAARSHGNELSLRCEVKPLANATELKAFKASGIAWNGNYGSMHLDTSGVPVHRVLGAFIYGLGLPFDRVLTPGEPIKTDAKF